MDELYHGDLLYFKCTCRVFFYVMSMDCILTHKTGCYISGNTLTPQFGTPCNSVQSLINHHQETTTAALYDLSEY